MAFQYPDALEIRTDLVAAYNKAWDIICRPGNWWTAQERIAIAEESRNARSCPFCAERKAALAVNSVEGRHHSTTTLPEPVVDVVHRITTDATRLSEPWVHALADHGISDGHYVELLGIVVAMISIDEFHLGMGLDLEALPRASSNEPPSAYRPPGAKFHGAWVPVVKPVDVSPSEADIYGGAPETGNVLSAMSLVPDSVRLLSILGGAQYLEPKDVANPHADGGRALDRMQIELLAGRVSSFNECFY